MEASNPFVGDPGTFDPEEAAAGGTVHPLSVVEVHWQPDRVARILRAQGLVTHEAVGVGKEDWLWRESELAAIAEPAANTLNKFPVTHAAAAVSDELTVGAVLLDYSVRSIRERTRVLRARREAAERQEAGQGPSAAPRPAPMAPPAPPPPAGGIEWAVPGEGPDGL